MIWHLCGFVVCSGIIFFAGRRLSYYGDLIAELSGLGKAWIGLILMAAVTSLPELMVGISSVRIIKSSDLATGDILGSCAFNLGILSLMDIFTPRNQPLFSKVSRSHILAAAFGIILITLTGLNIFLDWDIELTPFLGISSSCFLIVYLLAVRTIFNYQKNQQLTSYEESHPDTNLTLNQVILRYTGFALIIIATALTLPYLAEHIATETGLGQSFVGTLFLAISTSLPEIAVSFAAIRMGSTDMAVGNLLGSNLFNVFILFLDDIMYTKGHLLKDAAEIHLLSVFFVLMMTAVAIIGFIFPAKEKRILLSWDTFTIFGLYLVNMCLLFLLSN